MDVNKGESCGAEWRNPAQEKPAEEKTDVELELPAEESNYRSFVDCE